MSGPYAFLSPSVNSRAELVPSPRANARKALRAVGSGINEHVYDIQYVVCNLIFSLQSVLTVQLSW
jgi:hypothetical protein